MNIQKRLAFSMIDVTHAEAREMWQTTTKRDGQKKNKRPRVKSKGETSLKWLQT
jgi:hypothetical protein